MKTSVIGYPRIGGLRELKFAAERFFAQELDADALLSQASKLRRAHWQAQRGAGVDCMVCNDFSLYDGLLDTAVLFGIVPARYARLGLSPLEEYFAMARGHQRGGLDVKALSMRKWYNTNYHYLVPEVEDGARIALSGEKPFDEFSEAKALGIDARPALPGPYTLLRLARFTQTKTAEDIADDLAAAYAELLRRFDRLGAAWVQLDEPSLVTGVSPADLALLGRLYAPILAQKGNVKVLLQTYFGDIRDSYDAVCALDFDGIGLDFVEGVESKNLVLQRGFPAGKTLFAGVVNGKNIWRNRYSQTLALLEALRGKTQNLVIGTSCSLLHVPYTVQNESALGPGVLRHLAFAAEKLGELSDLKTICKDENPRQHPLYLANEALFAAPRAGADPAVRRRLAALGDGDFTRLPARADRRPLQSRTLALPLLPATTIGSFPQTAEVRAQRAALRRGTINQEQYDAFIRRQIADCILLQENIGLDVLVHGEFERNDMVEYFGERLEGFLFTERAWVQSYGTRCVKPPIVWGDVSRPRPMTVEWSVWAQSRTKKPVKGMLTGPVTILNWSFPREDVSLRESALQIALAIRDEVLDLEAAGIRIIQIDEAALREKLPLRKSDWHGQYLDWAIPAFRLVHSGVRPETQIHTHMCYSEFGDIISDIDRMDADVISFEASRSDLAILGALHAAGFETQVGPGVYDIHSPRVPSAEEMEDALDCMLKVVPPDMLWVNPDCGLKTRGLTETVSSLENLVEAARAVRAGLRT